MGLQVGDDQQQIRGHAWVAWALGGDLIDRSLSGRREGLRATADARTSLACWVHERDEREEERERWRHEVTDTHHATTAAVSSAGKARSLRWGRDELPHAP